MSSLEERIERLHEAAAEVHETDVIRDAKQDDEESWMQANFRKSGTVGVASSALTDLNELEEEIRALETNYLKLWKIAVGEEAFENESHRFVIKQIAEDIEKRDKAVDSVSPHMIECIKYGLVILGELDLYSSGQE